jgi:hypothetical protein
MNDKDHQLDINILVASSTNLKVAISQKLIITNVFGSFSFESANLSLTILALMLR